MTSTAVQQLDELAHELRNRIGVLVLGVGLVGDEQLAGDMRDATWALRRMLDRLVMLARLELQRSPEPLRCSLAQLLELGAARARREGGGTSAIELPVEARAVEVSLPGTWAERLLADLHHALEGPAALLELGVVEVDDEGVALVLVQGAPSLAAGHVELATLAGSCRAVARAIGGGIEIDEHASGPRRVRLWLPRAG